MLEKVIPNQKLPGTLKLTASLPLKMDGFLLGLGVLSGDMLVFRGVVTYNCRVPKGGVFKGGGNWGTLRIPREDWGTLGKIREPPPLGPPP